MTIYEINYRNRLNEMLNEIIRKYGPEHERTYIFTYEYEHRINFPNYDNREYMELRYKRWMK